MAFYIPPDLVQSLLYNKHLLNYLVMFMLLNMLLKVLKSTAPVFFIIPKKAFRNFCGSKIY